MGFHPFLLSAVIPQKHLPVDGDLLVRGKVLLPLHLQSLHLNPIILDEVWVVLFEGLKCFFLDYLNGGLAHCPDVELFESRHWSSELHEGTDFETVDLVILETQLGERFEVLQKPQIVFLAQIGVLHDQCVEMGVASEKGGVYFVDGIEGQIQALKIGEVLEETNVLLVQRDEGLSDGVV